MAPVNATALSLRAPGRYECRRRPFYLQERWGVYNRLVWEGMSQRCSESGSRCLLWQDCGRETGQSDLELIFGQSGNAVGGRYGNGLRLSQLVRPLLGFMVFSLCVTCAAFSL